MSTREERIEAMAMAACRVIPNGAGCIMDDHPDRGVCTSENCEEHVRATAAYAALLAMGAIAKPSGGPDGYVAQIMADADRDRLRREWTGQKD